MVGMLSYSGRGGLCGAVLAFMIKTISKRLNIRNNKFRPLLLAKLYFFGLLKVQMTSTLVTRIE